MARKRVAILISGRGSNMAALIEAAKAAGLSGRDRAGASPTRRTRAGLARARDRGIATAVVDHRRSARTARRSSARCRRALKRTASSIVCLAGFMRLLTPWFVGAMGGPDAQHPPCAAAAFKGLDTHARALAAGVQGARRDRAFRRAGNGFRARSSRRRAVPVLADDTGDSSPRACSRSSTASIRWRCGSWPKAGCVSMEDRCLVDGILEPDEQLFVTSKQGAR